MFLTSGDEIQQMIDFGEDCDVGVKDVKIMLANSGRRCELSCSDALTRRRK